MGMKCGTGGRGKRCLFAVILAVLGVALLGLLVMLLWNWLAPAMFGGHEIGYLQAIGLLALSRILFGRWGGRHCPTNQLYRWHGMTDEERDRVRDGMRGCCIGGGKKDDQSPGSGS